MANRSGKLQKNQIIVPLALLCSFLWGSAFPCVKIGYEKFSILPDDSAAQILFAGLRFVLAGILIIIFGSIIRKKLLIPAKTSWGMVFKLCLAQTVIQYLFFYIGLSNISGVKSSIICGSGTFFAILISSLVYHLEKMGRWKILGCILGFAGVFIINLNGTGLDGSVTFMGEGFMLLSALSYAVSTVLIKKYGQSENPMVLSGYQFLMGGVIMALVGMIMGGRLNGFCPSSCILLLYLALISAVAYTLWSILLAYNPVGKIAVFGFMTPVFGVILSAVFLHEQNQAFTFQGLAALIFVSVGIYMVNRDFSEGKH